MKELKILFSILAVSLIIQSCNYENLEITDQKISEYSISENLNFRNIISTGPCSFDSNNGEYCVSMDNTFELAVCDDQCTYTVWLSELLNDILSTGCYYGGSPGITAHTPGCDDLIITNHIVFEEARLDNGTNYYDYLAKCFVAESTVNQILENIDETIMNNYPPGPTKYSPDVVIASSISDLNLDTRRVEIEIRWLEVCK